MSTRIARISARLSSFLALGALLSASACAEDTRLFPEDGTWSLTHWSLDGTDPVSINQMAQNNAFMLNFNESKGLAATAACSFQGGGNGPSDSTCQLASDPSEQEWFCSCFAYDYKDSTMQWTEYAPGTEPPPVGDGGGTGGTEGTQEIALSEYIVSNSYTFASLPGPSMFSPADGIFDSDGINSKHVFNQRAANLFEPTGCAAACYGE